MKQKLQSAKRLAACLLPLCFLVSCAGTTKTPEYLSSSFPDKALTTLAILPVSYADSYTEPRDVRLSPAILRDAKKSLDAKGYHTILLDELPSNATDASGNVITMDPSRLIAGVSADADGVIAIRIHSHFGLDITERNSQGMGPAISLNASARLISVQDGDELWRDEGMGRSLSDSWFLKRSQFWVQLNEASRSLMENLFRTLPARSD